jgi:hypothetical protein
MYDMSDIFGKYDAFGKSDSFSHVWVKPAAARVFAVLARAREPVSVRELARLANVAADTAARVIRELEARRQVITREEANRKLVQLKNRPHERELPPLPPISLDPARTRNRHLPWRYIRAQDLRKLGWPMRTADILVVPARWAAQAEVPRPYVTFRHERPLQWRTLRPEDIAVAFLDINPIVTRALFERANLDRRRLRRRILEEDKLEPAAAVHLDKPLRLPAPPHIDRIPEEQIQRQLRQNPALPLFARIRSRSALRR